jgi:hypothetical protein
VKSTMKWIVLAMALLFAATVFAQGVAIFQGVGEASLEGSSLVSARLSARKDALSKAVLQAIRQAVPAETYAQKQEAIHKTILKHADRYVQSFEILDSGQQEEKYVMSLEARVDLKRLIQEIDKIKVGSGKKSESRGRIVLIATTQWNDSEDPWPLIWEPLSARLEMVGLACAPQELTEKFLAADAFTRFKEERFESTADFAKEHNVRYVLTVRSVIKSQAGAGCPALARVKFLDATSGELLADFPYNFKPNAGCQETASVGAKTIFSLLTEKLHGRPILEQAPAVAQRLEVYGLRTYRDTTELTAMLRSIPDLKSISMQSFATGGRVVFRITYEGPTDRLATLIEKLAPHGYKLQPRIAPDDRLLFEASY